MYLKPLRAAVQCPTCLGAVEVPIWLEMTKIDSTPVSVTYLMEGKPMKEVHHCLANEPTDMTELGVGDE